MECRAWSVRGGMWSEKRGVEMCSGGRGVGSVKFGV